MMGQKNESLRQRLESKQASDIAVCSVVKAELFYGSRKSRNPNQNLNKQREFFQRFISLPFDDDALALILILDQFPRNLFRGQPQTFATDEKALTVANDAINQKFDQQLLSVQRAFIYLPFEHSENLADQSRSVELFTPLKDDPNTASMFDYAIAHANIIQKFGRFPHRNTILGRPSTPEELEFLTQPNSSF